MFGLGATELMIVLVIVIVVFGASRLPKIGEGLGKGITNFKKEVVHKKQETKVVENEKPPTGEVAEKPVERG